MSAEKPYGNGVVNQKERLMWFTTPFYPQCKGKIERCIRNFNEEYIRLDKVFEDISTFVGEYQEYYNNEMFNSSISDIPVNLYPSENVTDVT